MMVTLAYEWLAAEGFATTRVGSGTFVSQHGARTPERKMGKNKVLLQPRNVWNAFELPPIFGSPPSFDFRSGLPDAALFPHRTWQRLIKSALLRWHAPTLPQIALAQFIEEGEFARHVGRANKVYQQRHAIVTNTIAHDFADHLELIPSSTGLHVAVFAPKASVEWSASIGAIH